MSHLFFYSEAFVLPKIKTVPLAPFKLPRLGFGCGNFEVSFLFFLFSSFFPISPTILTAVKSSPQCLLGCHNFQKRNKFLLTEPSWLPEKKTQNHQSLVVSIEFNLSPENGRNLPSSRCGDNYKTRFIPSWISFSVLQWQGIHSSDSDRRVIACSEPSSTIVCVVLNLSHGWGQNSSSFHRSALLRR